MILYNQYYDMIYSNQYYVLLYLTSLRHQVNEGFFFFFNYSNRTKDFRSVNSYDLVRFLMI